jgi:PAS domain S-box-containing protein
MTMESENEYRMIFENSPLGIIYLDREGTISQCNDKIATILNAEKSILIGSNINEIFADKDIQDIIKRALSGEIVDYQGNILLPNIKVPVEIQLHCSPNISSQGSLLGTICTLEDISLRMSMENALKLDEHRLESLLKLEQMAEAPMQEITDFVHEQAILLTQSKIGYIAFMSKDESKLIMHTWSDSVMNECTVPDKQVVYSMDTVGLWGEPIRQRKPCIINDYLAPDPLIKGYPVGHVEVYNYLGIPVFDGDRIVATAGVGNKKENYDDSDVRQLTLLMKGLWRFMQRREAIENLRKYAEELERSNEMKDIFTDILRHDLLNPAAVVKGYTDLLIDSENDEGRLIFLQNIEKSNDKLIEMIKSAASFAKLDNIEDRELGEMDIASMLTKIVDGFKFQMDEKQMLVENNISDVKFMAKVNPMIEEVFVNFCSNAIKYSPDNEKIIIDILDNDNEWKVTFTDFGNGVADKDKTKIFTRFKRVDKSGVKGTGLGLTIAKKITELHGGSIGVEDNPAGRGSVFWVTVKKA